MLVLRIGLEPCAGTGPMVTTIRVLAVLAEADTVDLVADVEVVVLVQPRGTPHPVRQCLRDVLGDVVECLLGAVQRAFQDGVEGPGEGVLASGTTEEALGTVERRHAVHVQFAAVEGDLASAALEFLVVDEQVGATAARRVEQETSACGRQLHATVSMTVTMTAAVAADMRARTSRIRRQRKGIVRQVHDRVLDHRLQLGVDRAGDLGDQFVHDLVSRLVDKALHQLPHGRDLGGAEDGGQASCDEGQAD
ncbi:hypothetical protein ACNFR7_27180 [Streptomyces sp. RM1]